MARDASLLLGEKKQEHTTRHEPKRKSASAQEQDLTARLTDQTQIVAGAPEPIVAQRTHTTIDAPSVREALAGKSLGVRIARRMVTGVFSAWYGLSTKFAHALGWQPRVDPYVSYGTERFSRIVCRTVYGAPGHGIRRRVGRGITNLLMIPAAKVPVRVRIDGVPVTTVCVGQMSQFDSVESLAESHISQINTDSQGYLDLVTTRNISAGTHTVTCKVNHRSSVSAPLFISPYGAPVGIISDVDDTIMVSQVPNIPRAAVNLLFVSPHNRSSVPGMSVFYNRIADLFPGAPFFYLSTSPWNVEGSIRQLIRSHGFPQGPILLRDIDPRPKTFIPSGVQHKLEFAQQLMSDFPQMKFILLGDDGQHDPTTYARLTKLYPGRILAIGIRQLTTDERTIQQAFTPNSAPDVDVPVFYGQSGVSLMTTMLPFLKASAEKEGTTKEKND